MKQELKRLRNKEYLKWVTTLPCCNCPRKGETIQAHHFISRGMMSGGGLKAPDHWVMPLCFECHDKLHRGDKEMLDRQFEWVARTLALFFDQMSQGLGKMTMKTLIQGVGGRT